MQSTVASELLAWQRETGRHLVLTPVEVECIEVCDAIVDLNTGTWFEQHDSWMDFTERWVEEMLRRGVQPTAERLALAIGRASTLGADGGFCLNIAKATLPKVMAEFCTVQVA